GQDFVMLHADVNMSAHLMPDSQDEDRYACDVELNSTFILSNPNDTNTTSSLLYSPVWNRYKYISGINQSAPVWWVDENNTSIQVSTISDLTSPEQLPDGFQGRFSSGDLGDDNLWSGEIKFTLLQMALRPKAYVVLHLEDSLRFYISDLEYFDTGFGFSDDQLQEDQTSLRVRMNIEVAFPYDRIAFYPETNLSISQIHDTNVCEWSLKYPYSPFMLDGLSPDPIDAGCASIIMIHEYFPPGWNRTIPSEDSTYSLVVLNTIVGFIFLPISIVGVIFVILHFYRRR
ncbi:MAG: hypothetical protein ACFFF4_18065, partial [Candidatus Thorarchaeota archaeon]